MLVPREASPRLILYKLNGLSISDPKSLTCTLGAKLDFLHGMQAESANRNGLVIDTPPYVTNQDVLGLDSIR